MEQALLRHGCKEGFGGLVLENLSQARSLKDEFGSMYGDGSFGTEEIRSGLEIG